MAPQYRNCVCGHLGGQHRQDGSCARCDCKKFKHPVRLYVREVRGSIIPSKDARR